MPDNWIGRIQVLLLQAGDFLELFIAERGVAHGLGLFRLAFAKAQARQQAADGVGAHGRSHPIETSRDLHARQVGPHHLFVHRIAGGVIADDLTKIRLQVRRGNASFDSPPLFFGVFSRIRG
jgi:hypothetical protein